MVLRKIDPSIEEDFRYADKHNFEGRPIPGYEHARYLLTRPAALALKQVQTEVKSLGLSLKVYDCYRPQRAVDEFVRWSEDHSDQKMKAEFYPHVDKTRVFEEGYVARKSGHSRGSTVDLTLILTAGEASAPYRDGETLRSCIAPASQRYADNSLDFGTGFDCFDPRSNTMDGRVGAIQMQRRLLLKALMEKHGFKNYEKEWWHYTLENEPFADTYFDFPFGSSGLTAWGGGSLSLSPW